MVKCRQFLNLREPGRNRIITRQFGQFNDVQYCTCMVIDSDALHGTARY